MKVCRKDDNNIILYEGNDKEEELELDTDIKTFKCDYDGCSAVFTILSSLKKHQRVHTSNKPYKCVFFGCGAVFSFSSALTKHEQRHPGFIQQKTDISAIDGSVTTIAGNGDNPSQKPKKTGNKRHACQYEGCFASFVNTSNLKVHVRSHTGEKPFQCNHDGCSAAFAQSNSLKLHLRHHTGEKSFKCNVDGSNAEYRDACALKAHERTHTGVKPYKCKKCFASFAQSGSLKYHNRTHTGGSGEKLYKCQYCGHQFGNLHHLLIHKRRHSGVKPFKCEYEDCKAAFTTSGNLLVHQRRHLGIKPYKCDECNAAFVESTSLKNHQRIHNSDFPLLPSSHPTIHLRRLSNTKRYKCAVDGCHASFQIRYQFLNHMRLHSGNKPFKCDDCEATFNEFNSLKSHKLSHKSIKPYQCDFDKCNAAFKAPYNLKVHQRMHTGEKPYKCFFDGCHGEFTSSTRLRVHQRTHLVTKADQQEGSEIFFVCEDDTFFDSGDIIIEEVSDSADQVIETDVDAYKCTFHGCDATYASSDDLLKHQQTHLATTNHLLEGRADLYNCEEETLVDDGCNTIIEEVSDDSPIQRIGTEEVTYKCDLDGCDATYASSDDLLNHQQTHLATTNHLLKDRADFYNCEEETLVDDGCNTIIEEVSDDSPIQLIGTEKVTYKCDLDGCGVIFTNSDNLIMHQQKHLTITHYQLIGTEELHNCDEGTFVCDESNITMKEISDVAPLQEMDTYVEPFKCNSDAEIISLDNVIQHREMHTETRHQLITTNMIFSDKTRVGKIFVPRHQPNRTEVTTFKCDYDGCEAVLISEHYLKLHQRKHKNTSDQQIPTDELPPNENDVINKTSNVSLKQKVDRKKPYVCVYEGCYGSFATPSNLQVHVRTHTGEKPYQCSIDGCGAAFAQSNALKAHMRVHTGEKPYKCDHDSCTAAFANLYLLKVHQRLHSGEKPYKCNFDNCDAAYSQLGAFKSHQRLHTGEKPYKCKLDGCNAAFRDVGPLRRHERSHKVEKAYKCMYKCNVDGCNASFARLGSMKSHAQTHMV